MAKNKNDKSFPMLSEKELVVLCLSMEHVARRYAINRNAQVDSTVFKNACHKWIEANPDFLHIAGRICFYIHEYHEADNELPDFIQKILDTLLGDIENYS